MPTFADRIKAALAVYRRGYPAEMITALEERKVRRARAMRLARMQQHAAPYRWPDYLIGNPSGDVEGFYENWVQEGFAGNSLIYSALLYKMRAVAKAPLRAYTDDNEQASPDHPLAKLVYRPNPYQSVRQFMMLNVGYLNLAGNSYCYVDRGGRSDGSPVALYPMRPDRVKVIGARKGADQFVIGYAYVREGESIVEAQKYLPRDVVHVRLPNLADPLEGMGAGMSPILPLAVSGDVDNAVTRYLKEFFQRGTMLAGLLTFDFELTDEEVARVKERWQEQYGGVENWDEIGVLDVNAKYQQLAMGFDEMGFAAVDERTESRILGPFGVPPILIGSRMGLLRSTYSNYEEARRMFWEDTMDFELSLFEDEYGYYLNDGQVYVKADRSDVPALQRNVPELVNAWSVLVDRGVPSIVAQGLLGIDMQPYAGDDTGTMRGAIALPSSPLAPRAEAPDETPPSEATEEGGEERQSIGQGAGEKKESHGADIDTARLIISDPLFLFKQEVYRRVDSTAGDWESRYRAASEVALDWDRRKIMGLINATRANAYVQHQTIDWAWTGERVQEFLLGESAENWRDEFDPLFRGLISEQAEQWNLDFGRQYNVQNLFALEWYPQYQFQFSTQINNTTNGLLQNFFGQAQHEGWSINQTMNRLRDVFNAWLEEHDPDDPDWQNMFDWFEERRPTYRLEAIARTETMRGSNAGSHNLFLAWGAQGKEWLATFDRRTRPDHMAAWADYHFGGNLGPVGMNEPFIVGGEPMMHPHDYNASAGQVVYCRCTELPFMPEYVDDGGTPGMEL